MDLFTIIDEYKEYTSNFDISDYEPIGKNLYKINGDDLMLFEFSSPGVFTGHYFFKSRGNQAILSAKKILNEIFSREDVKVLQGITPNNHKGAKWLTKKLGGTSYGVIETINGPCELFIMTKAQWRDKWGS